MSLICWQPHDFFNPDRRRGLDRLFEDFWGHDYEEDRSLWHRWNPTVKQIEVSANEIRPQSGASIVRRGNFPLRTSTI